MVTAVGRRPDRVRPSPARRRRRGRRHRRGARRDAPTSGASREVNSGLYAFDAATLRDALALVGTDNAQGEKYLTDVSALIHAKGGRHPGAHRSPTPGRLEGINDRVQLARLGAELNRRIVERWMRAGVTVVDPATTWIDVDVTLGRDVTIHPHTQILGAIDDRRRRRPRAGQHADRRRGR